ncbi:MAG: hypothetical protein ACKO90_01100, partial [Microcystis panniformis]
RGVFKKAGFGIHFHESRQFGFWSTNWNSLFAVEGGTGNTFIKGNVGIGTDSSKAKLDVKGDVSASGSLSFGSQERQMLNLYQNTFGIGVQKDTQYFRTGVNFAWYKGGSHDDAAGNAGTNGKTLMTLNENGNLAVLG